jgi:hypothetical protein
MRYHCIPIRMSKIQDTDGTPNAGGMWSNRNFHSLLLEMQNGITMLEYNWSISYQTKHALTVWPRTYKFLTGVDKWNPHKNLHKAYL